MSGSTLRERLEHAGFCDSFDRPMVGIDAAIETVADWLRQTMRDHFLAEIVCDHERKMDNPRCACSLVDLGWHASVGEAVQAWVEHVLGEYWVDDRDERADRDALAARLERAEKVVEAARALVHGYAGGELIPAHQREYFTDAELALEAAVDSYQKATETAPESTLGHERREGEVGHE